MYRFFQKTLFGFSIFAALLMSSCLGNDVEERDSKKENDEINQAITNLTAKGYDIDTTASGVYYIMGKTGTGDYPQPGDTCDLIYTGYFLNGTIFDASYFYHTDSIWEMVYKTNSVIPGFEEAVSLLNTGAKGDFFIPSRLAYGENGYNEIPPWTTLGFSIKMKAIRQAN